MTKNLYGGATINSGPSLPSASETPDGSLFYKTTAPNPGLYFFGFTPDANSGLFGNQGTQSWVLITETSGVSPFVLKSGDTMTGTLTSTAGFHITSTAPGIRFTETDQVSGSRDWRIVVDAEFMQFQILNDAGFHVGTPFSFDRFGQLLVNNAGTVWHSVNDGAGSGLDADLLDGQDGSFYTDLANSVGTLPISRGGTGQSAGLTQGGVIYALNTTAMASTAVGASSFLLQANGTSPPTWADPSTVTVGSATNANFATSAGNVGGYTAANFVLKTGDTMTGALTTTALAVGAISVPAVGSINLTGSVSAGANLIASGNLVTNGGNIFVGGTGAGRIIAGSASYGGSNAAPMYSFTPWSGTGGATNGFYMPGPNDLRLVVSSIDQVVFGVGGTTFAGNIVATGDITAFSDRRLKSNIAPIQDALTKVSALTGVTFNRKGTEKRGTGLIAQEVEAVAPEAVLTDTDGMKSVAYGNLVGLLVEAIKEQQRQIDVLTSAIIDLQLRA